MKDRRKAKKAVWSAIRVFALAAVIIAAALYLLLTMMGCKSPSVLIEGTVEHEPTRNTVIEIEPVREVELPDRDRLGDVTEPVRVIAPAKPVQAPDTSTLTVLDVTATHDVITVTTETRQYRYRQPAPGETLSIRPPDTDPDPDAYITGEPEAEDITVRTTEADARHAVGKDPRRGALGNIAATIKWAVLGLVLLIIAVIGLIGFQMAKQKMMFKQAGKSILEILSRRK